MVEIVEAGKGAYRVERYAIEPLPRDTVVDGNINNLEAVAEALKRAPQAPRHAHQEPRAWRCPTRAVITKKIIVPAGQREEDLEVQVESEANQYIPFSLDEVNLDFQVARARRPTARTSGSADRRLAQGEDRGPRGGGRSRRASRPS